MLQFSRLSFAYLKINNLNSHLFAEVTCYVPQNLQNHYYTNKKISYTTTSSTEAY